jgi:hypothetical protein
MSEFTLPANSKVGEGKIEFDGKPARIASRLGRAAEVQHHREAHEAARASVPRAWTKGSVLPRPAPSRQGSAKPPDGLPVTSGAVFSEMDDPRGRSGRSPEVFSGSPALVSMMSGLGRVGPHKRPIGGSSLEAARVKEGTSASRPLGSARSIAISGAVLDRSLPKARVQGQPQTARCYDALLMQ